MPTINLHVHVRPDSDALQRIVTLCGRRYLEILTMNYGGNAIRLTVRYEAARRRQIIQWLRAPVDVLDVVEDVSGGFERYAR
jgi:hypothetical protein